MSPGRAALAAFGWIALAATLLPAADPVRILVTVAFLALGPGAALVGLRRRLTPKVAPDAAEDRTLTVVLSLCLATLVSEGMYLGDVYSTPGTMSLLAAITTAAALWPVRHPAPAAGAEGAAAAGATRSRSAAGRERAKSPGYLDAPEHVDGPGSDDGPEAAKGTDGLGGAGGLRRRARKETDR